MKVKEDSGKAGLKLSVKRPKIMASGSITSWQVEGKKVEAVTDFLFMDSTLQMVTAAMKLEYDCFLAGKL